MRYLLAVDMGTTAFKASVFDERGVLQGSAVKEYSIQGKLPGWAEVPVEVYEETFAASIGMALKNSGIEPENIECLVMSTQGETTVFLDNTGNPIRPAIVWLDNRASLEAEEIVKEFGMDQIQKNTGQVGADSIWPGAKIRWLSKHEPENFKNIRRLVQLNGYFGWLLTGRFTEDDSLLGSSIYWNINTREYWPEVLEYLGISEDMLPEVVAPGCIIGRVTPGGARRFGLAEGTKVSIGAIDLVCGAVGVGNVKPGIFSESTGSALCTMTMVDHPVLDPNRQIPLYCGAQPGQYMVHSYATGGMMMRWFRDAFCELELLQEESRGKNAYDQLDDLAREVPAGSEGLIVLPHLQGSGPPDLNAGARAVFYGMTIAHKKGHLARAIMESVAVVLSRMIEGAEALDVEIDHVISYSGGAKSPLWSQIKADVLGLPVYTTQNDENAPGLGAVMIAGRELGIWDSLEQAAEQIVETSTVYMPNPDNREVYETLKSSYKLLMQQLRPLFDGKIE